MGFIHVAVVALSLMSAGQSAPVTDCESLIQPAEIQGRDQVRLFHLTHYSSITPLLSALLCDHLWSFQLRDTLSVSAVR